MKILHILDHSIPLHSGYTFRTLAILRQQKALGWKTTQVTSAKQGKCSADIEEIEDFRFYRTLPRNNFLESVPILVQTSVIQSLKNRIIDVIQQEKPDILHAHSPSLNGVAALAAGRKTGLPVMYECRAFWEDAAVDHGTHREGGLRYKLSRNLETYVFKHVNAITTICNGLREDIIARGISPDKITVIPNGVDTDRFLIDKSLSTTSAITRESLNLGDGPILGFIGSFYAYEGLALLIQSIPKLLVAEPNVRLILVGGGPEDEGLRVLAKELKLDKKILFTGRVSHTEVEHYYNAIDVLVYPRLSMRLTELVTPLKPLEAMAQGRLVAASNIGGHRELIEDKKTGFLFPPDSPETLVEFLAHIIRSRDGWTRISKTAREFVETERTWAKSVSGYQSIYNSLIE
ncbi:TIGR04063 family PEP-CTERM/XrtA system glycosyltransferase [Candidatus Nitrosacidococcus sp. I8]|uniref:TIGR04063 family PEP-CTERM/XrtA system glycosyltransferase n=1 Tax=Candidatus Nitrosacidococcus sp. I8 TaxID=2942908 RepID=UPI00222706CB|nr:TIGR04063 family PEP-CTERM/XrtA system glycosyltransferase [Candidatus Nitrosacidococcus sp. I8]CAH9019192.1 D-inositol-3-phosphate glycosyltransferase [Candidatus Nitrosacidococcus sp. I8]